jgi:hypothetical protein
LLWGFDDFFLIWIWFLLKFSFLVWRMWLRLDVGPIPKSFDSLVSPLAPRGWQMSRMPSLKVAFLFPYIALFRLFYKRIIGFRRAFFWNLVVFYFIKVQSPNVRRKTFSGFFNPPPQVLNLFELNFFLP